MENISDILESQNWFFRNLDKELKHSLKQYTDESYKTINNALRNKKDLSQDDQKIKNDIDTIFDMIDPITSTITLYRGIKSTNYTKADEAFISTSYDIEQAKEFTRRNCCIIVFTIPPGSKVLFVESISEHPYEKEVIINRKGDFKITLLNEGATYGEINKIFITYNPPISVSATTENLENVVDLAINQMSIIERVIDIFPEDEYEIFKDDDESLKSSIKDILKQVNVNSPNQTIIMTIIERLKNKYD